MLISVVKEADDGLSPFDSNTRPDATIASATSEVPTSQAYCNFDKRDQYSMDLSQQR
jgi:hypothetical protein